MLPPTETSRYLSQLNILSVAEVLFRKPEVLPEIREVFTLLRRTKSCAGCVHMERV
jgi:hypothetical protein